MREKSTHCAEKSIPDASRTAGNIIHTFDLPVPPSVNRTRKVDWRGKALLDDWKERADMWVLAQARGRPQIIGGQFEAVITLRDGATRMDLDNAAKEIIDYARSHRAGSQ